MIFLLDGILKTSFILLAALLSMRLLRRQSAALRHGVLTAALFCAAILPVLTLALRVWDLFPAAQIPLHVPLEAAPAVMSDPVVQSSTTTALHWWQPGWVWLTGAAIGTLVLLMGLFRLNRITRRSEKLTIGMWTRSIADLCGEYRIRRPILLLRSADALALFTWGWLRPKVVVPARAMDWPAEQVEVVLRHELAHVRRRDWTVQMTAQAFRILYWFNPLIWILCRRLRLESELACDDAVISRGISGSDYARHLLALARTLNKPGYSWSAAMTMAESSNIERRFTAMLNPQINRRPATRFAKLLIVAVALLMTVSLAAVTPQPQAPAPVTTTHAAAPVIPHAMPNAPIVAQVSPTPPANTPAQEETRRQQEREQLERQVREQHEAEQRAREEQRAIEKSAIQEAQDRVRDTQREAERMLNLRQRDLEQMSRLREQLESVRGNIRQEVRSSDRDLSQLREDIQKMQMELNIVRAELKLLLESIVRRLDTIQPKQ